MAWCALNMLLPLSLYGNISFWAQEDCIFDWLCLVHPTQYAHNYILQCAVLCNTMWSLHDVCLLCNSLSHFLWNLARSQQMRSDITCIMSCHNIVGLPVAMMISTTHKKSCIDSHNAWKFKKNSTIQSFTNLAITMIYWWKHCNHVPQPCDTNIQKAISNRICFFNYH